ncbi:MAG: hypothetical protein V3V34_11675 [Kiloniellales bacterium]
MSKLAKTQPTDVAAQLPAHLDTSGAAAMVTARAEVEARFLMAERHPRDWITVRTRVLQSCERPRFAEGAMYKVPVGGGNYAEGPSIRLAEELHRCAGNLDVRRVLVHDDDERQIWRVTVTDLETNSSESADCDVAKHVERRELKEGERAASSRRNSSGQIVYLVIADETTLRRKRNAEMSRAKRNAVVALVPVDVTEDACTRCREIVQANIAEDPFAAQKRVYDGFSKLGIEPDQLATYLGKPLAQMLPDDLDELRGLVVALRDGTTTWKKAQAAKRKALAEPDAPKVSASTTAPDAPALAPPAGADEANGHDRPSKAELLQWGTKRLGAEKWKDLLVEIVGPDWSKQPWTNSQIDRLWGEIS